MKADKKRLKWLEERKTGIGGSDIPVLFNISKYKTIFELWQEKTNKIDVSNEDTPEIRRGRTMEPIIANMYGELTNRIVSTIDGIQRHKDKPYLIGDPDRTLYDPSKKSVGILEIKAPNLAPFGKMIRDNSARFQDFLQLQHYMLVTRAKWGAIACHNSERWQMIHWDYDRDLNIISQIEERCEQFWDYVKRDEPPDRLCSPDLLLPEMGSEPTIRIIDTSNWKQAVEQYTEAKELEQEVKNMVERAKEDIKIIMAEDRAVEGCGVRAYRSINKGRKSLDRRALVKAHPDIDLSKFEKEGKAFEQLKVYFLREAYE